MLSNTVQTILRDAVVEVQRRHHELLTIEHVLFAMTKNMKARVILEGSGVSLGVLREQLEGFFRTELEVLPEEVQFEVSQTVGMQRVLQRALAHVQSAGKEVVDVGDLLVAMMEEESFALYYLNRQGVERLDVLTFVSHGLENDEEESEENSEGGRKDPLSQYTTELIAKAKAGDARAQYDLARSYQTGMDGVVDEGKAVFWLQKAADQGLMEAETSLGSAYDTGMGVPISNAKAVFWWQRAARHGSLFALRCLGYSYIEGRGVAPSNLNAYVIWRQLPPDDAEAVGILEALRKNLSAAELAKGDAMTLEDVFGTGDLAKDQTATEPAEKRNDNDSN